MAQSIQHDQATLILELSAASTPNIHSPITSPGSQLRDAIVSIPLVQNIRQVSSTAVPSYANPLSRSLPGWLFAGADVIKRAIKSATNNERARDVMSSEKTAPGKGGYRAPPQRYVDGRRVDRGRFIRAQSRIGDGGHG